MLEGTTDNQSNDTQNSASAGTKPIHNVEQWFSRSRAESIHKPESNGNPIIARGAFGEISVAIQTGSDKWRLVAVKTILQSTNAGSNPWSAPSTSSSKPQLSREVFHEICALRRLNKHPNIVELLAVYPASQQDLMSGKAVSLAFTYCPTDLYLTMEWRRRVLKPVLPIDIIKTIAKDVFSAIDHCHSNGILHLDIKPGNFLVSSAGYIQLCDFGLAKPFQKDPKEPTAGEESKGLCTLYYRPPEVLLGGSADDPAVDMYSAGVVLAELLTSLPLFQGDNVLGQLALLFEVLGTPDEADWPEACDLPDYGKLQFSPKSKKPLEMLLPRTLESPFLLDLFYSLIVLNPTKRLSAKEALVHQWFASYPVPAKRMKMQTELIPTNVLNNACYLLTNPNMDLSVASKQALDQAAMRRSFLSSLNEWNNDANTGQSSLQGCCQQLSAALSAKSAT